MLHCQTDFRLGYIALVSCFLSIIWGGFGKGKRGRKGASA